ncbi:MAG: hypothetical protein ABSB76_34435 [Streptosporangiaceae bacterium]
MHILRCTVPHPYPGGRFRGSGLEGGAASWRAARQAGGRGGAGGAGQALAGRLPARAARVSPAAGPRAGQVLAGGGYGPRDCLIAALVVKRRRVFSRSAYGCGMHRAGMVPAWPVAARARWPGFPGLPRACWR